MPFREPKNDVLSRARTPEDKAKVRDAIIAAGHRLLAEGDPSRVSLRMIAAEAGYAPGTIYQYFADQRELFFHVRARDMHSATEELRKLIARTRDPAKRVQKLFIGTADYWLAHMEDFLIIFPAPTVDDPKVAPGAVPFGKSTVVQESLDLYYETVEGFFQPCHGSPCRPGLATGHVDCRGSRCNRFPVHDAHDGMVRHPRNGEPTGDDSRSAVGVGRSRPMSAGQGCQGPGLGVLP